MYHAETIILNGDRIVIQQRANLLDTIGRKMAHTFIIYYFIHRIEFQCRVTDYGDIHSRGVGASQFFSRSKPQNKSRHHFNLYKNLISSVKVNNISPSKRPIF